MRAARRGEVLRSFVTRDEVDPVYFNARYDVHPDGNIAAEAFPVIGAAIAEAGVAASAG